MERLHLNNFKVCFECPSKSFLRLDYIESDPADLFADITSMPPPALGLSETLQSFQFVTSPSILIQPIQEF